MHNAELLNNKTNKIHTIRSHNKTLADKAIKIYKKLKRIK